VKAQNVYQRLDWELLLFFGALFVVIHGFQASGAVDFLIARFHHAFEGSFEKQLVGVSGLMLILSNLVSNVPAVLLFKPIVASFPGQPFHLARRREFQHARGECDATQFGREFDRAAAGRQTRFYIVLAVYTCGAGDHHAHHAGEHGNSRYRAPLVSWKLNREKKKAEAAHTTASANLQVLAKLQLNGFTSRGNNSRRPGPS
jgi:hypothetical protein